MYNGSVLLNGDFDVKGYTTEEKLKVTTYSDDVRSGDYAFTKLFVKFDDEGEIIPETLPNKKEDVTLYDATKPETDKVEVPGETFDYELSDAFPDGCVATVKKDTIVVTGPKGFEMEFQVRNDGSNGVAINNTSGIGIDVTGLGAMNVQIGVSEGQELGVRISTISLRTLGLENLDCSTKENSEEFLGQLKDSLAYINRARSRLGSYQVRLEHTISTLDISEENMTGAYSRIMDADMADEMTEYSKNQVLVQASTSMVAQANERPSSVLQLLQ